MSKKILIRILQSKGVAIIFGLIFFIVSLCVVNGDATVPRPFDGLVFSGENPFDGSPALSYLLNIVSLGMIALFPVVINRDYRLIKSSTWYYVGIFFLIQLSFRQQLVTFGPASLLALCIGASTWLLFSTYSSPHSGRTVFLIGFIVVGSSLWVAPAIFLLPIFVVGMEQMRILGLKTGLALLLGAITPFWIVWGFELAEPFELMVPVSSLSLADMASQWSVAGLVTFIFIVLASVVALFGVLMKAINYNFMRRAFNAFICLLIITLLILVFIDAGNIPVYITLLNVLSAFQGAHLLANLSVDKALTWLTGLPVLLGVLAVWNYL